MTALVATVLLALLRAEDYAGWLERKYPELEGVATVYRQVADWSWLPVADAWERRQISFLSDRAGSMGEIMVPVDEDPGSSWKSESVGGANQSFLQDVDDVSVVGDDSSWSGLQNMENPGKVVSAPGNFSAESQKRSDDPPPSHQSNSSNGPAQNDKPTAVADQKKHPQMESSTAKNQQQKGDSSGSKVGDSSWSPPVVVDIAVGKQPPQGSRQEQSKSTVLEKCINPPSKEKNGSIPIAPNSKQADDKSDPPSKEQADDLPDQPSQDELDEWISETVGDNLPHQVDIVVPEPNTEKLKPANFEIPDNMSLEVLDPKKSKQDQEHNVVPSRVEEKLAAPVSGPENQNPELKKKGERQAVSAANKESSRQRPQNLPKPDRLPPEELGRLENNEQDDLQNPLSKNELESWIVSTVGHWSQSDSGVLVMEEQIPGKMDQLLDELAGEPSSSWPPMDQQLVKDPDLFNLDSLLPPVAARLPKHAQNSSSQQKQKEQQRNEEIPQAIPLPDDSNQQIGSNRPRQPQGNQQPRLQQDNRPAQQVRPSLPDQELAGVAANKNRKPGPWRILLVGDSMMEDFGLVIKYDLARRRDVKFILAARHSTGLVRRDYYDWPTNMERLIRKEQPDLVVIAVGGNDHQPIREGEKRYYACRPDWQAAYGRRVAEMIQVAHSRGVGMIWIGQPVIGVESLVEKIHIINQVQEQVCHQMGVPFVDTEPTLADKNGRFQSFMRDSRGKIIRLRTKDKQHMTNQGNRILLNQFMPFLEKALAQIEQTYEEES